MKIIFCRYGWVPLMRQRDDGFYPNGIADGNRIPQAGDLVAIGEIAGMVPLGQSQQAALPPGLKLGPPDRARGFWPVLTDSA